ncbi:MAG: hypothetical protein AB7O59_07395 [Pirellulales bacterium]
MSEILAAHESRSWTSSQPAPARRVVLIGASNLTFGIGTVMSVAHRIWGQPLEVIAAHGLGRSYGAPSRVLGRQLPGILECGLWQTLVERPDVPTAALVTDVGNDILYERPVDEIAGWVDEVLERLAAIGSRNVMTLLPTDHLPGLSRARFLLTRSVFMPRCSLSLATVTHRAMELNERLREIGARREAAVVNQQAAWYGLDPMHIRWTRRPAAWSSILAAWNSDFALPHHRRSVLDGHRVRLRTPHQRRLFGVEQRRPQPAVRLADGTTVAIY